MIPVSDKYRVNDLPFQVATLWPRLAPLLEFGQHLAEDDSRALSLALYEELELLTGLVQQYFDYADDMYNSDFEKYAEIKDKMLFGVVKLMGAR